ncbi:hypothetical protein [Roseitranquillus sediminis]|uniref:hypothetical protein n=1 Tax=Roseitranquillus sediminis TaxID=2809051 RepID=UPI001D0C9B16|nr:hypothetical protein [Roseitranquillus sediminis]MBM9594137.1 hypothetical protein [Roseitranquillus sediminis]
MIALAGLLGALIGAWRAHKREGTRLDMAQWAAVHAIAFGLVALIVVTAAARLS